MKFKFLTKEFYDDYDELNFPEICRKSTRPYTQTTCIIGELLFAIPLRSSITHDNVLWTNKKEGCGLDFSKAVLITDVEKYIDNITRPYIRDDEHKVLLGKEHTVKSKMEKYINDYKIAKENINIPHNKKLCDFSTLKYFEDYIYFEDELSEEESA